MDNLYMYIIGGVLVSIFLIYFYQRKKKEITEHDIENYEDGLLEEELEDDFMDEVDFSRQLHYDFSHQIVRDEFFKNPNAFIDLLLTQKNTVHNIWDNAQDYYMEHYAEVSKPIENENLSLHAYTSDEIVFVIIEMPTPKQMTEVYFIGMIIDKREDNHVLQYITLEYGEDENKSVLGAWTEDGIHLNNGDSFTVTLDDFKGFTLAKENIQCSKGIDMWRQVE